MNQGALTFVIPTYRLREVGETVRHYDEHFRRNGHAVDIVVFDDSTPATQEKYFPALEAVPTHSDLYYVGPREKEAFTAHLHRRLQDRKLEPLVKNLFRPSYGGNRNVALMYDLGISFDYDGQVTLEDCDGILQRVVALHRRVRDAAETTSNVERAAALRGFAAALEKAFYGFEPDFFQQNLSRIVDDVISEFKGSLELWPTLVEIVYLHKRRAGLPMRRVQNPRKGHGVAAH